MPVRREQVAAALKYLGDKADLRGRAERALSLDPQEQDLADIAVETGASLIPGVGQALAARDVERARRANDPAGMAMAAASAIPGERLAKLLKGFDPTRLELDVYHGTPHRFPATEANPLGEFDASKIGTGEGAQAYGHGVYLAESPKVAGGYAEKLAYTSKIPMSGYDVASRSNPELVQKLKAVFGDDEIRINRAIVKPTEFKNLSPELKAEINAFKRQSKGTLYKADLPDEMIGRMLDWDKPIKDQPETVQNAMRQAFGEYAVKYAIGNEMDWKKFQSMFGFKNEADFSEKLRQAGIPGIKYLDAGSRGQGGTGTRNFVVFPGEEKKVRILERK